MRLLRLLTVGSVLMLAIGLMAGCGEQKEEVAETIRPVRYEPVYATGGSRVRSFSGVAQAGVESNLSFRVPGKLQRLAVKVGDAVRAGELIAQLDPGDYELQQDEARASLQQSQAEERSARSNYERIRGLYENNNASKNDLDQARSAAESASARVSAGEKRLELARLQFSYTSLRASVAGAVASVDVDANENVSAGQVIAMLTSGARLEVEVSVPEILISHIREGEKVTVSFDALADQDFDAHVTEVGVSSTGLVTTFPVTVLLDREQSDARSGMAAEVAFRFESTDKRERFLVPPVAVAEDRQGRFVFVAVPTEGDRATVERRLVTVGELTDEGIEVFEGLFEDDLLITAGVTKIHDGQIVRLTGDRGQN